MGNVSTKVGQNMKRIRTKRKMSQGDIARVSNVDKGYIGNIGNGKKTATLATIQNLADELLK
jgi:transcriptional regulator with XRE-family HTH domain